MALRAGTDGQYSEIESGDGPNSFPRSAGEGEDSPWSAALKP